MLCLALVVELHHPLPGPGAVAGTDWAVASVASYWPILRACWRFAECRTGASVTLAVSPSWMALASDPSARDLALAEFHRRAVEVPGRQPLYQFVERWEGDPLAVIRQLSNSESIEVITTTSSHTWLPSIAGEPVLARAQIRLAVEDHIRRLGVRPPGIWLPFLGYAPGLESTMAEAGLRFFGVTSDAFSRGTTLPPDQAFAPLVTPAGVAVFGVSPVPTNPIFDPEVGYGRDPRYGDPAQAGQAATDHSRHFLKSWRSFASASSASRTGQGVAISVAAITAHDLGMVWPQGQGGDWLEQVLLRLTSFEGATPLSLGQYLDRHPTAQVGRPGPSAGGFLAARPCGSDLFDRCRAAADVLTYALEHRDQLNPLERRTIAAMTRSLLRAQQVDWSLPAHLGVEPEVGLQRASRHLDQFYELAGLLLAGRPDPCLIKRLERGPAYLPVIDLNSLAR